MNLREQKWEEQKVVASRNRTGVSSETVAVGFAKSTTIRTDHYTIATHPADFGRLMEYKQIHMCQKMVCVVVFSCDAHDWLGSRVED